MTLERVKADPYTPYFNPNARRGTCDAGPRPSTDAEIRNVALYALIDLASNPRRIARFLAERGLDLDDLRRGALDRELQAHAIAHVTRDRGRINRFSQRSGLSESLVRRAARHIAASNNGVDAA